MAVMSSSMLLSQQILHCIVCSICSSCLCMSLRGLFLSGMFSSPRKASNEMWVKTRNMSGKENNKVVEGKRVYSSSNNPWKNSQLFTVSNTEEKQYNCSPVSTTIYETLKFFISFDGHGLKLEENLFDVKTFSRQWKVKFAWRLYLPFWKQITNVSVAWR